MIIMEPPNFRKIGSCASCDHRNYYQDNLCDLYECACGYRFVCDSYCERKNW
jgi:hypothetical protein